ncbi:hypothetical protein T09_10177 [Trichinella sp. T9]|nr:hypothetical protein T09_10177 [Trichinella sp. T9]
MEEQEYGKKTETDLEYGDKPGERNKNEKHTR